MLDQTTIDHAALELAVRHARASDPERRRQIDDMLKDGEDWAEVAKFCAYCEQKRTLRLKPWMVPPSRVDADAAYDAGSWRDAQRLLNEMLALGISRYHPDPAAAIEEAKRRDRR